MKGSIRECLIETRKDHSDFVDAFAYTIAVQEAMLRDEYILLYIKKKPRFFPSFIYRWFIKKFVVLSSFKK